MGGKVRIIQTQTTEIDHPLKTRVCSCRPKRSGRRSISLDEVFPGQRVHQVIGSVGVSECRTETVGFVDVAEDRLAGT